MLRVSYEVKCPDHPKYTGQRSPRTSCRACHDMRLIVQIPGPIHSDSGLVMDKTIEES